MNKKMIVVAALAALATLAGLALWSGGREPTAPAVAASAAAGPDIAPVMAGLRDNLAAYRKIIILFADEKTLSEGERAQANQVGQALFHENRQRVIDLEAALDAIVGSGDAGRFAAVAGLLDYIESAPELYDADRLAFRELLRSLQAAVAKDGAL